MPTVYKFDEQNIYVSALDAEAKPNPEEAGKYLLTARGTLEEPMSLGENEIAVWNGASWNDILDPRGTYWKKVDATETKEVIDITEDISDWTKTDPGEGAQFKFWNTETEVWDFELNVAKVAKKIEIKSQAQTIITADDKYPLWKQNNVNELKGHSEADKTAMWTFIDDIRSQSDTFEDQVDDLSTETAYSEYTFEYTIS